MIRGRVVGREARFDSPARFRNRAFFDQQACVHVDSLCLHGTRDNVSTWFCLCL